MHVRRLTWLGFAILLFLAGRQLRLSREFQLQRSGGDDADGYVFRGSSSDAVSVKLFSLNDDGKRRDFVVTEGGEITWCVYKNVLREKYEFTPKLAAEALLCRDRRSSFSHRDPVLDLLCRWYPYPEQNRKVPVAEDGMDPPCQDKVVDAVHLAEGREKIVWAGVTRIGSFPVVAKMSGKDPKYKVDFFFRRIEDMMKSSNDIPLVLREAAKAIHKSDACGDLAHWRTLSSNKVERVLPRNVWGKGAADVVIVASLYPQEIVHLYQTNPMLFVQFIQRWGALADFSASAEVFAALLDIAKCSPTNADTRQSLIDACANASQSEKEKWMCFMKSFAKQKSVELKTFPDSRKKALLPIQYGTCDGGAVVEERTVPMIVALDAIHYHAAESEKEKSIQQLALKRLAQRAVRFLRVLLDEAFAVAYDIHEGQLGLPFDDSPAAVRDDNFGLKLLDLDIVDIDTSSFLLDKICSQDSECPRLQTCDLTTSYCMPRSCSEDSDCDHPQTCDRAASQCKLRDREAIYVQILCDRIFRCAFRDDSFVAKLCAAMRHNDYHENNDNNNERAVTIAQLQRRVDDLVRQGEREVNHL